MPRQQSNLLIMSENNGKKEYIVYSNKYSMHKRETKTRGTVYDVHFRVWDKSGNVIQKKLSGFKSKTEARFRYSKFIQDHCEFVYDRPKKAADSPSEPSKRTLDSYAQEYFATLGNRNKTATAYDRANIFQLFVLPELGSLTPKELTRTELYGWQERLWSAKNPRTDEYYSYKYLVKIRAHFSSFLSWMQDKYGFANNLSGISVPKSVAPKKEMQFWTAEEFGQFIATVEDDTYHAFFVFAFYTGRRKGELLALTPSDISDKAIRWNKSLTRKTNNGSPWAITTTKSGKSQLLPYSQAIKDEIALLKPTGEFVFGGGKPLSENTIRRYFNKHCQIAGVKQIRIHDLRHSFVSMLIHAGVNLTVVADLIGDTLEQVTKTYAHMYTEDREKALMMLPKCY